MYELYSSAARSGQLLPWQSIHVSDVENASRLYLSQEFVTITSRRILRSVLDTLFGGSADAPSERNVVVLQGGARYGSPEFLEDLTTAATACVQEVQMRMRALIKARCASLSATPAFSYLKPSPHDVVAAIKKAYKRRWLCGGLILVPLCSDDQDPCPMEAGPRGRIEYATVLLCLWILNHWWVAAGCGQPTRLLKTVIHINGPAWSIFLPAPREQRRVFLYELPRFYVCAAWRRLVLMTEATPHPIPYAFPSLNRPLSHVLYRAYHSSLPFGRRWLFDQCFSFIRVVELAGYTFWLARHNDLSGLSLLHPLSMHEFAFAVHFDAIGPLAWQRLNQEFGDKLLREAIKNLEIKMEDLECFQRAFDEDPNACLNLYLLQHV